jgi:hypothetical protein
MALQYEFLGWVYHIGVNSVGHEYCHLRFLTIRGKSVAMYKRDPLDNPEIVRSLPSLPLIFLIFRFWCLGWLTAS